MAQHNARHLYLTWRWAAKNTSAWPGEIAVCGLRIMCTGNGDAVPGLGEGTVTMNPFLVNDASTSSSTTNLNKTQVWAGDGGGSINVTDGDQDGLAEACYAFNNSVSTFLTTQYQLQDIRLYAVGDDGKMVGNGPCLYVPKTTKSGGSSVSWQPQQSLVMTLKSAAPGRKGTGRFYVGPLTTSQMGTDGLVAGSFIPTFGGLGQTFLNAIRAIGTIASTRYTPVIYHRGTVTGAVINTVRVGDEWDTQQRRRHQRKETYSAYGLS